MKTCLTFECDPNFNLPYSGPKATKFDRQNEVKLKHNRKRSIKLKPKTSKIETLCSQLTLRINLRQIKVVSHFQLQHRSEEINKITTAPSHIRTY